MCMAGWGIWGSCYRADEVGRRESSKMSGQDSFKWEIRGEKEGKKVDGKDITAM
jgi:hypothetical protein